MEQYTLKDAQDHLKQLIEHARQGKTIVILDEENQAVQLVPIKITRKPRTAGSARGQIKMASDFDEPDFQVLKPPHSSSIPVKNYHLSL